MVTNLAPPTTPVDRPSFACIESAHEYIQVLRETAREAHETVQEELESACSRNLTANQHDALLLASYKLQQLETHLHATSQLLNHLRAIRKFLYEDREPGDERA